MNNDKWQEDEAVKRFEMISPLLNNELDNAKKIQLREQIAKSNNVSVRTIYRYENAYASGQFSGLKPADRSKHRSQSLPDNWDEIVGEAIILKREVPGRSVRAIIKILEIEKWAPPGVIKRSTLNRYLIKAGFSVKQMRRYTEKRETTSRRFCRPHRLELIQGDIKYGPKIRTKDGKLIKTYLSSLIDDHSRFILQAEFYDNQCAEIVEDTFHKAILQWGTFDACYLDNGKQYISAQLQRSLARLGIKALHAKVRACESKGKVEKYHQIVDRFIAEIEVAHVHSVEELNAKWKVFLDQDYQREPHEGIREYYESQGVELPQGGITPLQEWERDSRGLKFLDTSVVGRAFLHREKRTIDDAGCFSFDGHKYEASVAIRNSEVEIAYDPMNTETITVYYQDMAPIEAHKVRIGSFSDKKTAIPAAMTNESPATSRFLDALEKRYNEDRQRMTNAISFGGFRKDGE